MSLFRIDRSTVAYKKNENPFILATASAIRPAAPALEELVDPAEPPQEEGAAVELELSGEEPEVAAPPPPPQPTPEELLAGAQASATEILRAAKEEAAAITAKAALDAAEQKNAATQAGHAEGYAKGEKEGVDLYQAAMRDTQKTLKSALERFDRQRDDLIHEMERECVSLAMEITEQVLGEAIEGSDFAFLMLAQHALGAIKNDGRVQMRVSPNEYARLFADEPGGLSTETLSVTVVEDDTLGSGDLVLESDIEAVNAGLRRQLAAVREALGQSQGEAK